MEQRCEVGARNDATVRDVAKVGPLDAYKVDILEAKIFSALGSYGVAETLSKVLVKVQSTERLGGRQCRFAIAIRDRCSGFNTPAGIIFSKASFYNESVVTCSTS